MEWVKKKCIVCDKYVAKLIEGSKFEKGAGIICYTCICQIIPTEAPLKPDVDLPPGFDDLLKGYRK